MDTPFYKTKILHDSFEQQIHFLFKVTKNEQSRKQYSSFFSL